jgi:hypothetical protein
MLGQEAADDLVLFTHYRGLAAALRASLGELPGAP